ncbi:unnamed protein product [Ectocarpus sp. 6 AP-2014]
MLLKQIPFFRCCSRTVSAPGKILVAGGYLVLDRPNIGVVLAATARFFTSVKWTEEKTPAPVAAPVPEKSLQQSLLRIKVESPQFRSVHWYECVVYEDGRLPVLLASSDQTSNVFVERALTYVLGYLLQAKGVGGGKSNDVKDTVRSAGDQGHALAIKLRAHNDFYSQTSQLRARGLPSTSGALATLPPFLECPVSEDGAVVVAKTGMGSSAALVSSLVGALLSFFGAARLPCFDGAPDEGPTGAPACGSLSGTDAAVLGVNESLDLTHNLAQACHCVAQGKVGSGFDVSAAVYGTHTYTRFSPSELADALSAGDAASADGSSSFSASPTPIERITACVQARGGWDAERSKLRLPPCFRLLMGDVCGGSSTPSMVRKVQAWRAHPSTADEAKELWSTLGSTNTVIAKTLNALAARAAVVPGGSTGGQSFEADAKVLSALPPSKWAELAGSGTLGADSLQELLHLRTAFAKARQLLREMGEDAGVPIEPPVQTKLVNATSTLPGVLCAGVPGAGGVDAVFAIVVHPDAEDGVRDLWASWRVGADTQSEGEGATVCPLLLTASEGGLEGGIVSSRTLGWE